MYTIKFEMQFLKSDIQKESFERTSYMDAKRTFDDLCRISDLLYNVKGSIIVELISGNPDLPNLKYSSSLLIY